MADAFWAIIEQMRAEGPLIQCITNFVSMDIVANSLLAAGASPAMAHSLEEVEDFIGAASGLLVNIGTLEPTWVASMKLAAMKCVALGKPWVLDPVGAGATPYRTRAALAMLSHKPAVVRGNAGEILALSGMAGTVRGVDATKGIPDDSAQTAAKKLAASFGCIVAVSGPVDYVTDGRQVVRVANGTSMLQKVTATGCSVTALIAATCSAQPGDYLKAAAAGLAFFGVAAECAEERFPEAGPASFRVHLIDQLHTVTADQFKDRVRITFEQVSD